MTPRSERDALTPASLPIVASVLLVLLPKCPLCLGIYLAMFTGLGAGSLPLGWIWPVAWLALGVGVGLIARSCWQTRRFGPLLGAAAGVTLLMAARAFAAPSFVLVGAACLIGAASLWSVAHKRAEQQPTVRHDQAAAPRRVSAQRCPCEP